MSSFGFDPAAIPPAVANRVLEREAWAQTCLAAHAGMTFAVAVGPAAATFLIDPAGKLEPAPRADAPPDLSLTIAPLSLPSFLSEPARWDEYVTATGDPALGATLKGLAETLPWFVERAFSEVLGPIVGLRVADAGRQLLSFPAYAAARVGASVGSFARDESGLVTTSDEGRAFGTAVEGVAARVAGLSARLDALTARLARGESGKPA